MQRVHPHSDIRPVTNTCALDPRRLLADQGQATDAWLADSQLGSRDQTRCRAAYCFEGAPDESGWGLCAANADELDETEFHLAWECNDCQPRLGR